MGESPRSDAASEEGLRVVKLCPQEEEVTVPEEEPRLTTPAAAVYVGAALSGIIGVKGRRRPLKSDVKDRLNCGTAFETVGLECREGSGIPGVVVKCVDIGEHQWRRRLPGR